MKETTKQVLTDMLERYPALKGNENEVFSVYQILSGVAVNLFHNL